MHAFFVHNSLVAIGGWPPADHFTLVTWNPQIGESDVEIKHELNKDRYEFAIFHSKRILDMFQKTEVNSFISFYHCPIVPLVVKSLPNE